MNEKSKYQANVFFRECKITQPLDRLCEVGLDYIHGLGVGKAGGKIIFEGYPKDIITDKISLTGKHLDIYASLMKS